MTGRKIIYGAEQWRIERLLRREFGFTADDIDRLERLLYLDREGEKYNGVEQYFPVNDKYRDRRYPENKSEGPWMAIVGAPDTEQDHA